MKYVYDEKVEIKRIFDEGFVSGNVPNNYELSLLAKHFRLEEKLGKVGIRNAIYDFLEDREIENLYQTNIERASKKAIRRSSYKRPNYPIPVYDGDLDMLDKVHDFNYHKIILSLIVLARSGKNPKVVSADNSYIDFILYMSGVRISKDTFIKEISHAGYRHGIFQNNLGKNGSYYMLMYEPSGEIVFRIYENTFTAVGDVYQDYIGGRLYWCDDCGKRFIKTGRNSKYCETHAEERNKQRVKKHRERNNSD